MAYRTILVHCNDRRRIARVAGAASELAEPFGAHVVGFSVSPPVLVVPAGMPGTPDTMVIDERCQAYRRDIPAMKAAFEAAVRARGLAGEWREEDAGSATVADVALHHARTCDVIVAAQRDRHWTLSHWLDIPDRLAVESGRPVLIIPNEGLHASIGTKVLVAWNGRREAALAAFAALPLLKRAREVKLLSVRPEAVGGERRGGSSSDLCAALGRHGVACEVLEVRPQGSVGHTLLTQAIAERADLLVMGCYGHSRFSEFALGGATRHVLEHMLIPVLTAH